MGSKQRWIILAALVAAAAAAVAFLPVEEWLLLVVRWVRGAGATGVIVYGLVYVAASVLLLPGSLLTLGAGFAYGPWWGFAVVSPVSVLAATAAFLVGRHLARDRVAARLAGDTRFAAVDRAVGARGFAVVLLLRLSPLFPFNLSNYALGLTSVRLRSYVLASWIGMLPGTFLYVYLGSLVTHAAELLDGRGLDAGPWGTALLWGGLFATVAVVVLITQIARGALNRALADPAAATT